MSQPNNGAVYITLGNGKDIGIDSFGELRIVNHNAPAGTPKVIPLGTATKARIETIKKYLDQLAIHAVDV